MSPSATGHLLVAQPTMADPNFFRSVVFVVDHGEEGAFGVVLNRPTATPVVLVLPEFADAIGEPEVFFEGGPVGTDNVLGLVPDDESIGRLADLGAVRDSSDPLPSMRLFAGYAGWAPRQLDLELAEGSWVMLEAESDDLFGPSPGELWEAVLRRQGGAVARLSLYPEDVSVN